MYEARMLKDILLSLDPPPSIDQVIVIIKDYLIKGLRKYICGRH
jgi:hypothetical protein